VTHVCPGQSLAAFQECWSEKPEVDGSTPSLTTNQAAMSDGWDGSRPRPSSQLKSVSLHSNTSEPEPCFSQAWTASRTYQRRIGSLGSGAGTGTDGDGSGRSSFRLGTDGATRSGSIRILRTGFPMSANEILLGNGRINFHWTLVDTMKQVGSA
jgi:hypothetical protein